MKKRLLSMLLVFMMLLSAAACGGGGKESPDKAGNSSAPKGSQSDTSLDKDEGSKAAAEEEDPYEVIMTYLTTGSAPRDLTLVEEAINAITEPAINCRVKFKPLTIAESNSQYTLWVSSGEKIDLMMIAFQGIDSYINMGQLEELNDLIETNAPYIHECAGEFPLYEGASKDGIVYGITPVGSTYGSRFCYFGRADLLEDIEIDGNKLYGYDDLEKVFAAMKAKAPDTAPLAVQGSDIKPTASYSAQFIDKMDILGATVQSGVLIGDSTTIVNLFETDEYMEYLRHMRDWYNKGYILKEAATSDDLKLDLMMSGRTSGYMIKNTPMQLGNAYRDYGIEFKSMQVTSLYNASTASTANYYWTIPITCERPDKAMQFLNMTYESEAIVNLIQNGIEGKHYVKTENPGIVRFPEGVDTATNGFYNPLGLYGDKRKAYYWEPTEADIVERNEAYTMEALANPTIAVGYNYDASAMTNQLTAISNVLAEYLPSLETGSVDPDKVMPEFLEKLKSAGIDEVIADNQSQFDQWLKENGK